MGSLSASEKSANGGRPPGKIEAPLSKKLEDAEWGEYRIVDVFDVKNTQSILSRDLVLNSGEIPYLCASSENNAVSSYVSYDERYIDKGNCVFIGGKTFSVSYQREDFFSNDSHNLALYLKDIEKRTKPIQLFLTTCITMSLKHKYSWGNSISNNKIQDDTVLLPIKDGKIDFDFMESLVAELEAQRVAELTAYLTVSGYDNYKLSSEELDALQYFRTLGDSDWGTYKIGNLFERVRTKKLPYKAKELPKQPIDDCVLPCLTSSFQNQGLNYYAPKAGATVLSNVISIPSNSDVYRAYYQSRDFTVLSDAYAIRWKGEIKLSPNQYLFMVMCINKVTDLPVYSYKNKLGGWNTVKEESIRLPEKNGRIDFDLMETFISAVKKLAIKDVVLYSDRKIVATKKVVSKAGQ